MVNNYNHECSIGDKNCSDCFGRDDLFFHFAVWAKLNLEID